MYTNNKSRTDYRVCSLCGAVLDVGERCECIDNDNKKIGYNPLSYKQRVKETIRTVTT